jgi:hypothetical protein
MKKNIFTLIIVYFSILIFNSCEDFIDLSPLDKLSINDYWKTTSDLENYMLQFYPGMPLFHSWYPGDADDLFYGNTSPNSTLNGERTLRTGSWTGEWSSIRAVNIFFENYEKCQDPFETYQHYVGEAHFFRAALYFEKVKTYGDVPWYSEVLEIDSSEGLLRPRDSRTLVIDNILSDLDKAAIYLDYRKDRGNNYLTKEAALAFKTRVALFEGTWQKYHANTPFGTQGANPNKYFQECIEAAEELMNGDYKVGIYSTGNPNEDYFKLFGFDDMSNIDEVILYKAFNGSEGFGTTTQTYVTREHRGKGATWEFITQYLSKDGLLYDYGQLAQTTKGNDFLTKIANDCDPRLRQSIWIPGDLMAATGSSLLGNYFDKPSINLGSNYLCPTGFSIKKTANPYSPAAGQEWDVPSETGHILIRYAEVLLNYAEAKYELDNSVSYEQLNLLRYRAGLPDFFVHSQLGDIHCVDYGYTISDELYEIRRERSVELAFEHFRSLDYRRWAAHTLFKGKRPKGYPFNEEEFPDFNALIDDNGLIDFFKNILPNGYQFRENQDYLTSIPQGELTLNPNLTQNPGWGN